MPPFVKRGGFASGENDATKRWIDLMDGRPKLVHIDETNSRAAEKLLGSQEELVEDTYFLMQMPCVLPEMRNPEPRPQWWDECISACCKFFSKNQRVPGRLSGRRSLPGAGGCPLSRCRWDARYLHAACTGHAAAF